MGKGRGSVILVITYERKRYLIRTRGRGRGGCLPILSLSLGWERETNKSTDSAIENDPNPVSMYMNHTESK
jgi:hypothetical protein